MKQIEIKHITECKKNIGNRYQWDVNIYLNKEQNKVLHHIQNNSDIFKNYTKQLIADELNELELLIR